MNTQGCLLADGAVFFFNIKGKAMDNHPLLLFLGYNYASESQTYLSAVYIQYKEQACP